MEIKTVGNPLLNNLNNPKTKKQKKTKKKFLSQIIYLLTRCLKHAADQQKVKAYNRMNGHFPETRFYISGL